MSKPMTGQDIERLLARWNQGSPCSKTAIAHEALIQMKLERDVMLSVLVGPLDPADLPSEHLETYSRLIDEATSLWGVGATNT